MCSESTRLQGKRTKLEEVWKCSKPELVNIIAMEKERYETERRKILAEQELGKMRRRYEDREDMWLKSWLQTRLLASIELAATPNGGLKIASPYSSEGWVGRCSYEGDECCGSFYHVTPHFTSRTFAHQHP